MTVSWHPETLLRIERKNQSVESFVFCIKGNGICSYPEIRVQREIRIRIGRFSHLVKCGGKVRAERASFFIGQLDRLPRTSIKVWATENVSIVCFGPIFQVDNKRWWWIGRRADETLNRLSKRSATATQLHVHQLVHAPVVVFHRNLLSHKNSIGNCLLLMFFRIFIFYHNIENRWFLKDIGSFSCVFSSSSSSSLLSFFFSFNWKRLKMRGLLLLLLLAERLQQ